MTKVHLSNGEVVRIALADPDDGDVFSEADAFKVVAKDETAYVFRWSAIDYIEGYDNE